MSVLAFLENQWFENPERAKRTLAGAFKGDRERFIRTALFFRCMTGKNLKRLLGERICERIVWEETSREMGSHPGEKFPADLNHITSVITAHKPAIVIAFGATAQKAIRPLLLEGRGIAYYEAKHPAARYGVDEDLTQLRAFLEQAERDWKEENRPGPDAYVFEPTSLF